MSRSQPKPKIIYKNLDDLLKSNSVAKNQPKPNTHRHNPHSLTDISNRNEAATMPLRKLKFIQPTRTQTNDEANAPTVPTVDLYSTCYNEIDAIFTQLEDFFCQSKEKVLDQVRLTIQSKTSKNKYSIRAQEKVEEIKKMSDYIKHISKYFIDGEIPDLSMNNPIGRENSSSFSKTVATTGLTDHTVPTEQLEDESRKILSLSMKNSKVRANRRGEMINNRKKTVYQLILQEKENKARLATSTSKKAL